MKRFCKTDRYNKLDVIYYKGVSVYWSMAGTVE